MAEIGNWGQEGLPVSFGTRLLTSRTRWWWSAIGAWTAEAGAAPAAPEAWRTSADRMICMQYTYYRRKGCPVNRRAQVGPLEAGRAPATLSVGCADGTDRAEMTQR